MNIKSLSLLLVTICGSASAGYGTVNILNYTNDKTFSSVGFQCESSDKKTIINIPSMESLPPGGSIMIFNNGCQTGYHMQVVGEASGDWTYFQKCPIFNGQTTNYPTYNTNNTYEFDVWDDDCNAKYW